MTTKWFESAEVTKKFSESAHLRQYEVQLKKLNNSALFNEVLCQPLSSGGAGLLVVNVPRGKPSERRAAYTDAATRVIELLAIPEFSIAVFDWGLQPARAFMRKVVDKIENESPDLARRLIKKDNDTLFVKSEFGDHEPPWSRLDVYNTRVKYLDATGNPKLYIIFNPSE